MEPFFYEGQVMWSQVDANMHLRHSAYADFAAQARLMLLEKLGFTTNCFNNIILALSFSGKSLFICVKFLSTT
jgi:acyl-CoA thioester hydrolase